MKLLLAALVALPLAIPALPASADVGVTAPALTKVGQCVSTTVKQKMTRLEGVADSGDAVQYGNGIYGVTYDQVPELEAARVGDPVKLCLTSLPTDCPKGDDRGKTYKATDLRTYESWELPDAEHMCGGA